MPNVIFRLNIAATLREMEVGEVVEFFRDDVEVDIVRTAASRQKGRKFNVHKTPETIVVTRRS